jgi:hypothetical protein
MAEVDNHIESCFFFVTKEKEKEENQSRFLYVRDWRGTIWTWTSALSLADLLREWWNAAFPDESGMFAQVRKHPGGDWTPKSLREVSHDLRLALGKILRDALEWTQIYWLITTLSEVFWILCSARHGLPIFTGLPLHQLSMRCEMGWSV